MSSFYVVSIETVAKWNSINYFVNKDLSLTIHIESHMKYKIIITSNVKRIYLSSQIVWRHKWTTIFLSQTNWPIFAVVLEHRGHGIVVVADLVVRTGRIRIRFRPIGIEPQMIAIREVDVSDVVHFVNRNWKCKKWQNLSRNPFC